MEEIQFLVDEIAENLNKDMQDILQQIRDPRAKQRVAFISKFTRKLVNAAAPVSAKHAHNPKPFPKIREIPLHLTHHAQRTPQHYQQPYYIRTLSNHPQETQPHPVTPPKAEDITPPPPLEPTPPKQVQPPARPPPKEEKTLEHLTTPPPLRETLDLDLTKEPPQQPALQAQEEERVSLIKESATRKTVVHALLTKSFYRVIEPPLDDLEKQVLAEVRKRTVDAPNILKDKTRLYKKIRKVAKDLGITIDFENDDQMMKLRYYLIRNILNLAQIEPLLHDKAISKIICEGVGNPVMVIRNSKQYETNITFSRQETINNILLQIAQKTFQELSIDEPVLDATYKNYRVQGTLGTDIVPTKFIIIKS